MRIAQDKIIKQILYGGARCRRLVFDDNEDFATMFSLSRRRQEGKRGKEVGIGRKNQRVGRMERYIGERELLK